MTRTKKQQWHKFNNPQNRNRCHKRRLTYFIVGQLTLQAHETHPNRHMGQSSTAEILRSTRSWLNDIVQNHRISILNSTLEKQATATANVEQVKEQQLTKVEVLDVTRMLQPLGMVVNVS